MGYAKILLLLGPQKSWLIYYFIYKKKIYIYYNTSCLLCSEFRSTYSIYPQNYAFKAHILDAYPGYKKLRANLEKKSRRTGYFIYIDKKKKKKFQYFMPIVFRISVHIFHIHSKLCFQSTGNIIIYYLCFESIILSVYGICVPKF